MEHVLNTIHDRVCCQAIKDKPKQAITYSWFTSLLLVLVAFIVACVAGNQAGGGSRGVAFAGMWTIILTVALSVGGTLVMRKYQSTMAIGFFLGVVVVLLRGRRRGAAVPERPRGRRGGALPPSPRARCSSPSAPGCCSRCCSPARRRRGASA